MSSANYTYKIKSSGGYCSESKGTISVNQHAAVEAILHNSISPAAALAAHDLLDALEAAMDCGMVPNSSAKEGGASAYSR